MQTRLQASCTVEYSFFREFVKQMFENGYRFLFCGLHLENTTVRPQHWPRSAVSGSMNSRCKHRWRRWAIPRHNTRHDRKISKDTKTALLGLLFLATLAFYGDMCSSPIRIPLPRRQKGVRSRCRGRAECQEIDVSQSHYSPASRAPVLLAIALVLVAYGFAALEGLPQAATRLIEAAGHEHSQPTESPAFPSGQEPASLRLYPPLWTVLPFVLLLLGIALLPLIPRTARWWQRHRNQFFFAAALAAITLLYYLCLADYPIQGHWPAAHVTFHRGAGLNFAATWDVIANAILADYVPFIVLLFSLYAVSGGIRIEGDLRARPRTNLTFLAVGGVLASAVGTTGAAMLLIRPLLETNQERKYVKHTVIFFIFVVCNCGGCLLPTGDPPLLLGYLRGVPFCWTLSLWPQWLVVNALLLAVYYGWDKFWYYPREQALDLARDEAMLRPLRLRGIWPNALLLAAVVMAVALLDPSMPVPGTNWHPWLYLREVAELGLVALSLLLGRREVRQANRFHYGPIIEVAVLFFGIFICMQPALQVMAVEGRNLGLTRPWHYFWATGGLSSVLDNAPTYVVFVEAARSLTAQGNLVPTVAGVGAELLAAISLGSVFMGANTYIGNGPNFLVKAIAEESGVRMPSFFGYLLYSGGILLPLFALVTWLFLK